MRIPLSGLPIIPGLFLLLFGSEFCWDNPTGGGERTLQVLAKVALYGAVGLVGLHRFRKRQAVPRVMLNEFGVFIGLCLWFVITSVQTRTLATSVVSSLSMVAVAVYAFSVFALAEEDISRRIIETVKWATAFTVLLSCVMAIIDPDQFVTTKDYFEGSLKTRLRGVMGHPNALGRVCVIYLLITYYQSREICSSARRLMMEGGIAIAVLVTLILTQSRTSLLGCIGIIGADMGLSMLARVRRVRALDVVIVTAAICVLLLIIGRGAYRNQSTNLAAKLSRRGDASEVFELAGRRAVWADVLTLSNRRPLTGYGLRAGETVLKEFHSDQDLKSDWVALHAHNMFLEALLAGGYGAAAAMIACILLAFRASFAAHRRHGTPIDRLCIGVLATVVVLGLVERGVMGVYFHFVVFITFWLLAIYRSQVHNGREIPAKA